MKRVFALLLLVSTSFLLPIGAAAQMPTYVANVHFVMSPTYTSGSTITIAVQNSGSGEVVMRVSDSCTPYFKIYDAAGNQLSLTDPTLMCAQMIGEFSIAPGETKTVGAWDQYTYSTLECFTTPCPATSKTRVAPGTYTVTAQAITQGATESNSINTISRTFTITGQTSSGTFSDVQPSYWAYDHIMYLYNNTIAQGFGNGTFGPDRNITKAEIVKMALNSAGIPLLAGIAGNIPYKDVPLSHSLVMYVLTAKSRGLIPDSTYFYPQQPATRFFTLQLLMDAMGIKPSTTGYTQCGGFAAVPCPSSYTCIDNPSDSCDPAKGGADCGGICVRPSAGSVQPFSDVSSPTERAYTDYAQQQGIVSGYGNGTFGPNDPVTRAEMAKIIHNLLTNSGTQTTGTLSGHVSIGPLCPVEQVNVSCDQPAPEAYTAYTVIVYQWHTQTEVTRMTLGMSGNYTISLAPGSYSVTVTPGGIMPVTPKDTVVYAGQTTTLNFDIDTGIR